MSKIKIKNFGPIKEGYHEEDGWMDVKKVTVFIGNQGSGKSTIAKVISSLSWLEKAINRGDFFADGIIRQNIEKFFEYQRIDNYFKENTEIEYIGEIINIKYNKDIDVPVTKLKTNFHFKVPKIMYVPSERNFLSTIKNAFEAKNLPDTLYTFAEELRKGQTELNGKLIMLPIQKMQYRYDKKKETSYIGKGDDINFDLLESSSGYQSFVPLYLVTKFLSNELQKGENVLREQLNPNQSVRRNKEIADIMFDTSLSETEKNLKVKLIDAKYLNTCFINIVEEPEQNLFPDSQWEMLKSLLEFNNVNEDNKLIMTTHSPYLINYLTMCVKAENVYQLLREKNYKFSDPEFMQTNEIVPKSSTVKSSDLVIYELNEKEGSIKKLPNYKGLPSDENDLNSRLEDSNELFAQLLEIQQGL